MLTGTAFFSKDLDIESVVSASEKDEEEEEEGPQLPLQPSLYSRPFVLAADV